jgi:hypothetical protein
MRASCSSIRNTAAAPMTELNASVRIRLISDIEKRAQAIGARIQQLEATIEKGGAEGGAAVEKLEGEFRNLARTSRQAEKVERDFARAQRLLARNAAQSSRALSGTAQAQDRLSRSAKPARTGILGVTQAQKNQARGMAENINLASELGLGFAALSPQARMVGLSFATAGNNAFALASSLGPVGVIVGTMVGVLPQLIMSLGGASRAKQGYVDVTVAANRRMQREIHLIDQVISRRKTETRLMRIRQGLADEEETSALLETQTNERDAVRRGLIDTRLRRALGDERIDSLSRADREGLRALFERQSRGESIRSSELAQFGVAQRDLAQINARFRGQAASFGTADGGRGEIARRDAEIAELQSTLASVRQRTAQEHDDEQREATQRLIGDASRGLQTRLDEAIQSVGNRRTRERLQRAQSDGSLLDDPALLQRAFGDRTADVAGTALQLEDTRRQEAQAAQERLAVTLERLEQRLAEPPTVSVDVNVAGAENAEVSALGGSS